MLLTIVGWFLLFSGVVRSLFPGVAQLMMKKGLKGHSVTVSSFIVFVIGLVLLYYGFNL